MKKVTLQKQGSVSVKKQKQKRNRKLLVLPVLSGSLFLISSLVSNLYADWSRILMERQNYEELEQVFHVQPTTGCLIIHN